MAIQTGTERLPSSVNSNRGISLHRWNPHLFSINLTTEPPITLIYLTGPPVAYDEHQAYGAGVLLGHHLQQNKTEGTYKGTYFPKRNLSMFYPNS